MNKLFKDKDFLVSLVIGSFVGLIAGTISYNILYQPSQTREISLEATLGMCKTQKALSELKNLPEAEEEYQVFNYKLIYEGRSPYLIDSHYSKPIIA